MSKTTREMIGLLSLGAALLCFAVAARAAGRPQASRQDNSGSQEKPRLLSLPSRQAMEERAAALDVLQTQKPEDRLALADEFFRMYPNSPFLSRVQLAAAEAYRMLRNFEKAIEFGEKVLAKEKGDFVARILVAESLAEGTLPSQPGSQERYQKAEKLAREALQMIPRAYADGSRPLSVSVEDFNRQRRYVESQPRATLGFLHLLRGKNAQAAEELRQSIALNQLSPNGTDYLRLAVALVRQNEWRAAKAVLEKGAELGGSASVLAREYLVTVEKRLGEQKSSGKEKPQG